MAASPIGARLSAPEDQMPSLLQRLRDGLLRCLGLFPCGKGADALHQIHAELDAELVGLVRRQLSARHVLCEALLGGMSGLADVEWCEGTRLLRAGPRELDDVDGIGGRRSFQRVPGHAPARPPSPIHDLAAPDARAAGSSRSG